MIKTIEKNLGKEIKTARWEKLTKLYLETRSSRIQNMIAREARWCGYRMGGLITAHALRYFENPCARSQEGGIK